MKLEGLMKNIAVVTAFALLSTSATFAQDTTTSSGTDVVAAAPAAPAPPPADCRKVNKGGPIAGVTVGAVFWPFLPLSIPLLVTQSKKLKRRNAEIYEQTQRGCPPQ